LISKGVLHAELDAEWRSIDRLLEDHGQLLVECWRRTQILLKSGVIIDFQEEPDLRLERALLGFRDWPAAET
tara:strand:+ start:437 stop:652 length:216 start_codon:yes stop_codon:yes gene_type:complete